MIKIHDELDTNSPEQTIDGIDYVLQKIDLQTYLRISNIISNTVKREAWDVNEFNELLQKSQDLESHYHGLIAWTLAMVLRTIEANKKGK